MSYYQLLFGIPIVSSGLGTRMIQVKNNLVSSKLRARNPQPRLAHTSKLAGINLLLSRSWKTLPEKFQPECSTITKRSSCLRSLSSVLSIVEESLEAEFSQVMK